MGERASRSASIVSTGNVGRDNTACSGCRMERSAPVGLDMSGGCGTMGVPPDGEI